MFESFAAGVQALRAMAQEHAMPEVARLSDAAETRMSMALAGGGGLKGRLGRAYLDRARTRDENRPATERCIAILGFEGDAGEVKSRRGRATGAGAPQRRRGARGLAGAGMACRDGSRRHTCATIC